MEDVNTPTRLRNACDVCHKLKRRCTGSMPCETCASLGSSCFYSVAGRLGRPRGSRTRRNVETSRASQSTTPSPAFTPTPDTTTTTFDNMLYLNFDRFDPTSAYQMSMNPNHSPDASMGVFATAETDPLQNLDQMSAFDLSSPVQPPLGGATTPPMSPMHMKFDQQQQQQQQQLSAPFPQQQQIMPPPPQLTPASSSGSPPPSCQCISGLVSILHDLRFAGGDERTSCVGLDSVLSRVSEALTQWSAFAACPRCQNDSEDDDGETLLFAALSIRRVVAQLRVMGYLTGGGKEFEDRLDSGSEELGSLLHVGAFQVTGADRTMLLGVLRTITVRKLDSAVTTMQSMLRSKRARRGEANTAMLDHIECTLDDLAKAIKL